MQWQGSLLSIQHSRSWHCQEMVNVVSMESICNSASKKVTPEATLLMLLKAGLEILEHLQLLHCLKELDVSGEEAAA
jgi:hypothetical protein